MSGNSATDFSVSTSPISPEIRLFSQSQGEGEGDGEGEGEGEGVGDGVGDGVGCESRGPIVGRSSQVIGLSGMSLPPFATISPTVGPVQSGGTGA